MKLVWSELAVIDLENIKDYILKDSEYYALRFTQKILNVVEDIINYPFKGRAVPESDDNNIREILYHAYRIMYKVEEKKITLLAIIHGSRNLENFKIKPWEII